MKDTWRLVNKTELYNLADDPGQQNDIAAFLAAIVVEVLLIVALGAITGRYVGSVLQLFAIGVVQVVLLIVRIFWWSILIVIIMSFIAPGNYHPALGLLQQITEPLLAPARRLLPPMGGLDFSPILVFLLLGVVERQQNLRHGDVVLGKRVLIGVRQADLTGRRGGLAFLQLDRFTHQTEMAPGDVFIIETPGGGGYGSASATTPRGT